MGDFSFGGVFLALIISALILPKALANFLGEIAAWFEYYRDKKREEIKTRNNID